MKTQKILKTLFFLGIFISLPFLANAAGVESINNVLYKVVDTILLVLVAICTLMILFGGVVMLVSQGEPEKVKSGRQTILWAIIGLVVAGLAKIIAIVIADVVSSSL